MDSSDSNSPLTSEDPRSQPLGTLYLGCPAWACERWKGKLFTRTAPRNKWLPQYSSVFNTVEGNSTFYALPPLDTARRWAEAATDGFRFALKLPRSITHEARLVAAKREFQEFVEFARILQQAERLGPSFVQLPPDFSPRESRALVDFSRSLPDDLPWAIELRHHDWFDRGPVERDIDDLLRELRIDKVIFDSRPLYSLPPSDESEQVSQTRKPKTPIRQTVTGKYPFLRMVGRNRVTEVQAWSDAWSPIIANWLRAGMSPYVFTHTPDDFVAPDYARQLHSAIRHHLTELPALPAFPGLSQQSNRVKQLHLFD